MTSNQLSNAVRPLSPQGRPLEICAHCEVGQRFQLRRRTIRNGAVSLEWQCLDCGRSTGQPVAKRLVPDWQAHPEWDLALSAVREAEAEKERLQERQTKRAAYLAYLGSEEWQVRRQKVLRRDPVCRACEEAKSEQVHHLTYERIFREPLFDLVGICRRCHEEIHQEGVLDMAFESSEAFDENLSQV